MSTQPEETDVAAMEAKLRERPDLLERLKKGDTTALVELVEHGTEATISSVDVRLLA